MTGNVVLLGISVLGHGPSQAFRHLAPFAAFFAGVCTLHFVRDRLVRRASFYGLVLEIGVLLIAACFRAAFPRWHSPRS